MNTKLKLRATVAGVTTALLLAGAMLTWAAHLR